MALTQCIEEAKYFGIWLHGRVNEREFPDGTRERTGHSILQLAEDIGDAIIVLLEEPINLPGPALTLARPLFEGYVRGFWLLNLASETEVQNFMKGICPTLGSLLNKIPRDTNSGGAWIHKMWKLNKTYFNDLTHGGSLHVQRRFTDDSVEPSYPEKELESLLKIGIEIRISIGV